MISAPTPPLNPHAALTSSLERDMDSGRGTLAGRGAGHAALDRRDELWA